jgi:hypothetical protein
MVAAMSGRAIQSTMVRQGTLKCSAISSSERVPSK